MSIFVLAVAGDSDLVRTLSNNGVSFVPIFMSQELGEEFIRKQKWGDHTRLRPITDDELDQLLREHLEKGTAGYVGLGLPKSRRFHPMPIKDVIDGLAAWMQQRN